MVCVLSLPIISPIHASFASSQSAGAGLRQHGPQSIQNVLSGQSQHLATPGLTKFDLAEVFHVGRSKENWIPMNYSLKEQVTGLLLLAEKVWKARKGGEVSSRHEDKSSCPWSPVMISKLLKCLRSSSDQQTCHSPPTLTTYGYLLSSNDLTSVTLLPCRYSGRHP